MAHKKGGGSSRNGRDSNAKRLGVKAYGAKDVTAGSIIVRQRGHPYPPRTGGREGGATTPCSPWVPGTVTFTRVARTEVRDDPARGLTARGRVRSFTSVTHATSVGFSSVPAEAR